MFTAFGLTCSCLWLFVVVCGCLTCLVVNRSSLSVNQLLSDDQRNDSEKDDEEDAEHQNNSTRQHCECILSWVELGLGWIEWVAMG